MHPDFYRKVLHQSPLGYALHKIILNQEGIPVDYVFLEVNKAFEELTGLKATDIINKSVTEVIPGIRDESFNWIAFYGSVAMGGEEKSFDQYSETLKKWYKVQVFSPDINRFATLFTDITNEKTKNDELDNFFNVNLDLFCLVDLEGNFIKLNKSWETILGYPLQYIMQHKVLDFIHPDDVQPTLDAISSINREEDVIRFTNRYRCSDGNYKYIEWYSHPKDNKIYSAARDVTKSINEKHALQNLVQFSRKFIEFDKAIPAYDGITKFVGDLSGASYSVLNIEEEGNRNFKTLAICGVPSTLEKAVKFLGFHPVGRIWKFDPVREAKIKNQTITCFDSLHELSGNVLPQVIIRYLEKVFNLGKVYVVKITKDNKHLGDYTLLYKKNADIINRELIEFFANQTGIYLERLKAENALRESQTELTSLFDQAPIGYCELNENAEIVRMNDTGLKMLDYAREDILGNPVWKFAFDEEQTKKEVIKKLSGQYTPTGAYESCFRKRDGAAITFLTEDRILKDVFGNITGIRSSLMDITSRKKVEEELNSSRQRAQAIIDNIQSGLIIIDASTQEILEVNPAAAKLLGRPSQEMLGKTCKETICSFDFAACPFCTPTSSIQNKNCELIGKSGKKLQVLKTISNFSLNGRKCFLVSFVDISDRIRAEEAIRVSEQKFNKLFESNPALMAVSTLYDRRYVEVNSAFLSKTGYTKEEVIGKTSMELEMFPQKEKEQEMSDSIYSKGFVHNLELKLRKKDGEVLDGLFSAEIIESQNERFLLTVVTDITQQKQAETELLETNHYLAEAIENARILTEKANQASTAKSDFLAHMSHEIRTPLNGIIGFTDILKESATDTRQKHLAHNAYVSAISLLDLINDILDFSKIEAGKLELEEIETDLRALINQVNMIIGLAAARKKIEYIVKIHDNVPEFVFADPVRLKQILVNLLGNAVKFTEKGEVELEVSFEPGTNPGSGNFTFSVKDTGIGISPEQREKLFIAFTQADNSIARKFGGTGLGLVISNLLLDKMDSTLQLESQLGMGTRFYFSITRASKGTVTEVNLFNSVQRVLIIENNKTNREYLIGLFHRKKLDAYVAADELEALDICKKHSPFDEVIVNFALPNQKGIDCLLAVRKQLKSLGCKPLEILMNNVIEEHQADPLCKKHKIDLRLEKPVQPDVLFHLLAGNKEQVQFMDSPVKSIEIKEEAFQSRIRFANQGPKILIVDDSPLNLMLLQELVEGCIQDVTVLEARNGLEAVNIYRDQQPSLVLMDIQMPEMDGYEATQQIRRWEQNKRVRATIVAVSANVLREAKEKGAQAGMDDYLTKPVSRKSLMNILQRIPGVDIKTEIQENTSPVSIDNLHSFDRKALLDRIGESERLFSTILNQTLNEFPHYLNQLKTAVQSREVREIQKVAHKLKGAARNMCFDKLADLVLEIEEIDHGSMDLIEFLLKEIEIEWGIIRNQLEQEKVSST